MAALIAKSGAAGTADAVSKSKRKGTSKVLLQPKKTMQPWQIYYSRYYPDRVSATDEEYQTFVKTLAPGVKVPKVMGWCNKIIKEVFKKETKEIKAEIMAIKAAGEQTLEELAALVKPALSANASTHVTASGSAAASSSSSAPTAGPSSAGPSSVVQSGTGESEGGAVEEGGEEEEETEAMRAVQEAAIRVAIETKLLDREK